jgi:UDP-arabinose 4-epimerase
VTGGAGYIGSRTCRALAEAGWTPVSFDNFSRGHAGSVQWGPSAEGDIRDRDRLKQVLSTYRPVACIHFAALAYVGESASDPLAYYSTNVGGTICLVNALREAGVNAIVFSSSCATYGIPKVLPIREQDPQLPINPKAARS